LHIEELVQLVSDLCTKPPEPSGADEWLLFRQHCTALQVSRARFASTGEIVKGMRSRASSNWGQRELGTELAAASVVPPGIAALADSREAAFAGMQLEHSSSASKTCRSRANQAAKWTSNLIAITAAFPDRSVGW